MSREVLEKSIDLSIQFHCGEDIYIKTIFYRAQAHFHLHQYDEAIYVFSELVRLEPDSKNFQNWLRRSARKRKPKLVNQLLGFGVIMYLATVLLIVINEFIIENFYSNFSTAFNDFRVAVFVIGIVSLLSALLYDWSIAYLKVQKAIKSSSRRNKLS